MLTYNYPLSAHHKKAHADLAAQVLEIQERLEQREMDLSDEIMTFLKNWLIDHIQKTDKTLAVFLNEHLDEAQKQH